MSQKITYWILLLIFSLGFSYSQNSSDAYKEFNDYIGNEKAEILKSAIESFDKFLINNFKDEEDENQRIINFLISIQENGFEINENWIFNSELDKKIIEDFEKTGLRKEIWIYGYEQREIEEQWKKHYEKYRDSLLNTGSSLGNLSDLMIEEEIIPIQFDSNGNEIITPELDSLEIEVQRIEDSIEYNNTRFATELSEFVLILNKVELQDSLLLNYIDAKRAAGSISPSLLIGGFLYESEKTNYNDPLVKIILIYELYYWFMDWNLRKMDNE